MRDSPVSVSAQTKWCVCFVPLKIFLNYTRGLFFGILRFRNIGLSEHWAVPGHVQDSETHLLFPLAVLAM